MGEVIKTVLRIDSSLYERIRQLAEQEKRSINNMINVLLEAKLNDDSKKEGE